MREIERIDIELAALREQWECAGEQAAWLVLGDEPSERAAGREWAQHEDAMLVAIEALETRRLELQLRL